MNERDLFEPESAPLLYRGAEFLVRVLSIDAGAKMAAAPSKLAREALLVAEALHWKCGVRVFSSPARVLALPSTRADLIAAVKAKLVELSAPPAADPIVPKVDTSPMPVPPVPPGLDLDASK